MFYQTLFRNRWIALAFVAFTLISAYTLVGAEDESSLLGSMNGEAEGAQEQLAVIEAPPQPEVVVDEGFSDFPDDALSDEELIDPATGFDPTPSDSGEGIGDFADETLSQSASSDGNAFVTDAADDAPMFVE